MKKLAVLLALILALSFVTSTVKLARASGTIYIRADGSIDPPTAPIQREGDYYTLTGNITSDVHGITVQKSNVTIDGAGYTLQGSGFDHGIGFNLTSISHVTIKNTKITSFNNVGIWLNSSSYNTISGNDITANYWDAIWIRWHSNYNTISGNNLAGNRYGIECERASNYNTISDNNITANSYCGIEFLGASNNSVSGNNIADNGLGIELWLSRNNSVSGNSITANLYGGIWLLSSPNNSVSGNNITANSHYGIGLGEIVLDSPSNYNTISDNNITANDCGISLASSSYNTISSNNIANKGWGIYLEWHCYNNSIHHNRFANNAEVYSYKSLNVWDSGYPSGGNYWSGYAGMDFDGDGIGDTPYVIDADNQDRYPLMHPWSPLPVHNINTGLGYTTIQKAINANETLDGHTVFVEAGTYYEHATISKSIALIGQDKSITVIDGDGTGIVVEINAYVKNVTISGFTVQNGDYGIYQRIYSNNLRLLSNVVVKNKWVGIFLYWSFGSVVIGNNVSDNGVLGFPWWEGGIIATYSYNGSISNNTITKNSQGIHLFSSIGNTVNDNVVEYNIDGIGLKGICYNNSIYSNTITNNDGSGLHLAVQDGLEPVGNYIYHNSFVDNHYQVICDGTTSTWDDGYPSGGNHWSDYAGVDVKSGLNQDLPGSDETGDMPYIIDADNIDRYPLMVPYGAVPPLRYALTITVTASGTTNPNPETYSFAEKSSVQVTAIANANCLFYHWELDGVNVGSANPCTVIMGKDHELKAVFLLVLRLDVNSDGTVNLLDLILVSKAFGTFPGDPNYNPAADINEDSRINILDMILVATHFGQH